MTDVLGRTVSGVSFMLETGGWSVQMANVPAGMYQLTWKERGTTFSTPVHKITR
jgi:hypothetical protein